ncbi:hypothetical protein T265_11932 [Opisthorchis viverrini]|uniref:Glycoside hydrolase family 19 catalytic domain-containing protein n=1 Tax=Opisthorchis viverrini TaxID=6198 RepID=A0A074Z7N9_OPIVI|nr:hypothetical protein T265_11932 [Opisthorchis viverrini]KER19230.1 hypothetical protein T265_11932 [Opisthorchis viverrini]
MSPAEPVRFRERVIMNWSIYIFVLLGHVTIRSLANTVCVPVYTAHSLIGLYSQMQMLPFFIKETTHKVAENSSTAHDRKLLTRLLKTLRQPTTGFALLGAHQVDDPCDSCNSEQTCVNGICEPAGGNPCEGVVCGPNAACIHGSCRCNSGFEGNPVHGCTPVVANCETWPLRVDDVRRLQAFDHRCLSSVAGFRWRQCVSNEVIRKRVFGCSAGTSIRENIQHHRLRWLGRVIRIPEHRVPRRMLFSVPPSGWRKPRSGRHMTWKKGVKEITKRFCVLLVLYAFQDGVLVTPSVLNWRRCKKWRLIDVSGVRAVSFFPDCLIERLKACHTASRNPVEQLLTRADWDALFPNRWFKSPLWHLYYTPQQPWYYPQMEVDYYSYENFIEAVKSMEASGHGKFLNEPGTSLEDRKRELCAFLGNIAHETGEGENGLFYREELGYERTQGGWDGAYRSVGSRTTYKMGNTPVYFRNTTKLAGKLRFNSASYHGRGPLQLSWGYNYGDFSKAVYGDPQVLLYDPDRLLDEPKLGISAAIWFWMTQPDWRISHNPHNVIYKQLSSLKPWGFGRTIMAINGGLEGNAVENGASDADKKVTRRIKNYRRCAEYFKIPVGVDVYVSHSPLGMTTPELRNTLICELIWFFKRLTWNPAESLVWDVSRQLNVLHQAA